MADWSGIRDTLGKAADIAVKKTGEFADSAKKYVRLKNVDSKLSAKFELLGKLTYKQIKNGESYAERIATVMDDIDALREQRAEIVAEIEEEENKDEN
jgi:hypothetical protein